MQTRSWSGGLPAASFLAPFWSSSVFRTHYAVRLLIQHHALRRDLVQEPVSIVPVTLESLRGSHDQVPREGGIQCLHDPDRLIDFVIRRHHHQRIDVAPL